MNPHAEHGISVLPQKVEGSEIGKQNLVTSRIDLVRMFPFLSFLIMTTDMMFARKEQIPTMAATTIGGNKIFINEEFLNKLSRKERAFVIAHEILHIFLEHVGRAQEMNYHRSVWNIAADFCINSHLIELKEKRISMPKFGLYEERFKKLSADEIYHILLKENKNNPENVLKEYGQPSEDEEGNGSSGMRPYDELPEEPMSNEQRAENRQKIAASLNNTNLDELKNMGDGYADLIRAFQELVESKIPWKDVLAEYVTMSSRNRYTYNRISRKSYGSRIVFPTLTGESVSVAFGVDTSGSMSERDLGEALTELRGILDAFDDWKVTFLSCDTRAHIIGEYNSEDGDDFTTIDKSLFGGGGTDMAPIVEYVNDMEEPPSVIVIVTDGFIPEQSLDDAVDEIPVIVVVTTSGNDDLELNNCVVTSMKDT